ncbi:hypothetical protein DFR30_1264 [Thiogranum longum]|uniref:Uncharacterized protein n=1 Tax=Thiogranum longum TaxID=1537524 RepID=A0A4R1HCM0_9GAMM|nr:DUF5676 family membrane protein [Thiogranum longum]TCK18005.1 hypothetical protein DFR30_1264 [Thiogranum longum]
MKNRISIYAVGNATSLFLAITFVLCVGFDLLFPGYAMYTVWQDLLPGFEWLSVKSFFIGLVEAWAYGWYFALIWVPIYNVTASRKRSPDIT